MAALVDSHQQEVHALQSQLSAMRVSMQQLQSQLKSATARQGDNAERNARPEEAVDSDSVSGACEAAGDADPASEVRSELRETRSELRET
eukprot:2608351-Pleurochrysis_carterae.AAC.1